MAEVIFERDGEETAIHVQCMFRLLNGDRVLIGSTDMLYQERHDDDFDEAYSKHRMHYDAVAGRITELVEAGDFRVVAAAMTSDGGLRIDLADDVRMEVVPNFGGPSECWRLFNRGPDQPHYVYPLDAE